MTYISAALQRMVVERARNRCEYCRLSQHGQEATFHVDHVVPMAAGGPTDLDNLALACVSCSLRKGARQHAHDPETGQSVRIFNPRQDDWYAHFRWDAVRIIGLTPLGRATLSALQMNRDTILAIRQEELLAGRGPDMPD